MSQLIAAVPQTEPCRTIGEWQQDTNDKLLPVLQRYGVDLYNAGHVHNYQSTWPLCVQTDGNGKTFSTLCDGAQHFNDPKGTIHVTEGNGGVPGVPGTYSEYNCSRSVTDIRRVCGSGANHGRITIYNATTLMYEHVHNSDGTVGDRWIVRQSHHGPFTPALHSDSGAVH